MYHCFENREFMEGLGEEVKKTFCIIHGAVAICEIGDPRGLAGLVAQNRGITLSSTSTRRNLRRRGAA